MSNEWTCPFCDRAQLVANENRQLRIEKLYIGKTIHGEVGLHYAATRCLNAKCNEVTIAAGLYTGAIRDGHFRVAGAPVATWQLRPESTSKPQPEYIPASLREDYFEACLIRNKSPKAAATLARRCLQGMIRDFCKISKRRLIDEIKELRKLAEADMAPKGVSIETVEAIDHVRSVGNIGAHMEADISLIVDVDPGEAQALIELIEMLFVEWYVARQIRQDRLDKVKAISEKKQTIIQDGKTEKLAAGTGISEAPQEKNSSSE